MSDIDTTSLCRGRNSVLRWQLRTVYAALLLLVVLSLGTLTMVGRWKSTDAAQMGLETPAQSFTGPHGELQRRSVIGDLLLTPCQKRAVQAFVGLDGSASGFGVEVIGTCQAGRE
jgi:hypothetical protein